MKGDYETSDTFGMIACCFVGLYFIFLIGMIVVGGLVQGFEYLTCIDIASWIDGTGHCHD